MSSLRRFLDKNDVRDRDELLPASIRFNSQFFIKFVFSYNYTLALQTLGDIKVIKKKFEVI